MKHIVANLDQEAKWLHVSISRWVRERVTAMSALLTALLPDDDVTLWGLEPIAPGFVTGANGFVLPLFHIGTPPSIDLRWADPDARAVNDRRFAFELATELSTTLPGQRIITSRDELRDHVQHSGAMASPDGRWVCKAVWTSAGRDRVFSRDQNMPDGNFDRILKLGGAVIFEPWMPRVLDIAVVGHVGDSIELESPHTIKTTAEGGFHGIDLAPPRLEIAEHDHLLIVAERAGFALQQAGYRGPFGIDAFVYGKGFDRRIHPLCEINARYTFGHVAWALGRRLGITKLGFTPDMPRAGRELLISRDRVLAWVA